ncbi:MAG TPA: FAD binding domain-containing protein [Aggregatilineaceae bacterium]|nr:FAD binding domain-containing protein [Aggregatilineaceae bacterium]
MLLNLKTIHTPTTLEEAISWLAQPGAYPLYGGAALQRRSSSDVLAGVDLSQLELDYVRESENSLRLGSMLTLEQVRQACAERGEKYPRLGAVATMLAADWPETLRNTMTLGDLLMERESQSMTNVLLLALGVVIKRMDLNVHLTMPAWLTIPADVSRYLIAHVRISRGSQAVNVATEKVARTPADAPIVGAVACVEKTQAPVKQYTTLALCGVAKTPIPQPDAARTFDETGSIDQALDKLILDPPDDHWGSREYRSEMARVLTRRVLERASH